jgi:DNA-binding CsgD family transcriptional regulator
MIAMERQDTQRDDARDTAILLLWRKHKLDTVDIAARLGLKEWQVANRLLHLRGQRCD